MSCLCYPSLMPLSRFHPIIQRWFAGRFEGPTEAQAQGWPAIAHGRHTLIAAPTGSGKTLAAFLNCLDSLVRQGLEGELPDATQVVYVSPLKALSNDVHRNLEEPLAELTALAREMGTPLPEIRAAVRTGDTPARERQAHAKKPPHVLITTPESLFILLTSERGRRGLKSVHTLVLDELHAVVGNKRGAHLALSVERLCHLAGGPITRIGLSATQRPIEEVARFLVGNESPPSDKDSSAAYDERPGAPRGGAPIPSGPACTVVDTGHRRAMDLAIEMPEGRELGPIATHELWGQVLDQIAGQIRSHNTTLVFVNTRRLVERIAHQLSERLGEEQVVAHHGSLSRATRLDAERRLKQGQVQVCVATASLELGIDIGDVDLVCQIGSPRAIGVALQRIGRSGHSLRGMPKGRLYPLTRDELVEVLALLRAVHRGELDALAIPPWPLDILAQQIVAACACEDWEEDSLYDLVRRAYAYRELPREKFDQVIRTLSEGVAGRWGRGAAYLHRDGVHHRLKGRRGARIAALTSGGAIPDNADYTVIAEPEGTLVGTVNEDFAIESMAGDIFLLGNTPWRIRRVEAGSIRVEAAQGQSPTIPFWLGEAPGRTRELSEEVSSLRQGIDERLEDPRAAAEWAAGECGVSREAAEQAVEYIAEGKRVLGMVPTSRRLVAERFFDEAGGMQLVIHSPVGSRINRAWGLALRKRLCRTFDFELQASATDDGINISLGPQHSFPLEEVFRYLKSVTAESVLLQAVLGAPVFTTRWRWNATRSLALLRQTGGKRVPTAIQRMRADDLLAAVFPAQAACQDNRIGGGDVEPPDHPLVFETVRDCLTEALDLEGLTALLRAIELGEVQVYARETVQPSAFSHQLLNAMPYAFLDDAPLEERRARAVALRRALPEDAQDLGALDPGAIESEAANAWPPIRDAEELHDALLTLGLLTETDRTAHAEEPAAWREWFDALAADGRALRLYPEGADGQAALWAAMERAPMAAAAYPGSRLEPAPELHAVPEHEEAVVELLRGRVECSGPFTLREMAGSLRLPLPAVAQAVARLEAEGLLLRGRFRPAAPSDASLNGGAPSDAVEFCDRRILARIHRSTIGRLRREVEPVPAATFIRFLLRWQHATPDTRLSGEAGLAEVIEQLQGYEAAAGAWESSILPARVSGYTSTMLDNLCFGGEAVWGRFARRAPAGGPSAGTVALSRHGPVSLGLREELSWLLDQPQAPSSHEHASNGSHGPSQADQTDQQTPLAGAAAEVLDYLVAHGASFLPEIVSGIRRLPSEVEEALWQLVAAGRVTADGFNALRGLISGAAKRAARRSRFQRRPRLRVHSSRWAILRAEAHEKDPAEARAAQLLRRYGIVVPELLAREPMAPPWRVLLRVYRRAEARGEVRGGRFLAGFVGEQFALPEAVEALRALHKREPDGEVVRLSACDPLNVAGILTPGPRVTAVLGNEVALRDGVPVDASQGHEPAPALKWPVLMEGRSRRQDNHIPR